MSRINTSTQVDYRLGEVVPNVTVHPCGIISLHYLAWSDSDGFTIDFRADCPGHRECVKKLAQAFGWVVTEKEEDDG